MKKILKGNETLALAVSQAHVKVIPVFPITPQTSIIETLALLLKEKTFDAEYIPMESEHSVMAACIGAASAGVRTFTATSGQGLLYMHELLHWAGGGRLPIVMGVVNRAVAPGWNIWMDQSDSVSQRDTGWIQLYCSHHQELYDHLFIAYKLAEKLLLPVMIIQDAFFLSHTTGEFDLVEQKKINQFLPLAPNTPFAFDFNAPKTLNSLSDASNYMEFRFGVEQAFKKVELELLNLYQEWESLTGRNYALYEEYLIDDAQYVLVLSGTAYETGKKAIDLLRKNGILAGAIKIRALRPFFKDKIKKILSHKKKIIVVDRNYSFGGGGVFASELKSALYGLSVPILSVIAGLGGRDLTTNTLVEILKQGISQSSDEIWESRVIP